MSEPIRISDGITVRSVVFGPPTKKPLSMSEVTARSSTLDIPAFLTASQLTNLVTNLQSELAQAWEEIETLRKNPSDPAYFAMVQGVASLNIELAQAREEIAELSGERVILMLNRGRLEDDVERFKEDAQSKQKIIEHACWDSAHDDTEIRKLALTCGVTQEQLDSDPSIIGVVEMIVEKLGQELLDSREKQNVRYDIGVSHGKQGLKDRLATKDAEIKRLREALERIMRFGIDCRPHSTFQGLVTLVGVEIPDICREAIKSEGGEG